MSLFETDVHSHSCERRNRWQSKSGYARNFPFLYFPTVPCFGLNAPFHVHFTSMFPIAWQSAWSVHSLRNAPCTEEALLYFTLSLSASYCLSGALSNHVKGTITFKGNLVMENNEADVSFRFLIYEPGYMDKFI